MLGFRPAALVALVCTVLAVALPLHSHAHPLGNFSISQYTGIRVTREAIELRYFVDMAEIPTFQEIQDTGIAPEPGHPSLSPYLSRKADALKEQLHLQVEGATLRLTTEASEILFPPGAGGLPTLKLGLVYRAALPPLSGQPVRLTYRDANYPDRAGWKEIIAVAGAGVSITGASVADRDRSRELSDYPTDLLNSPPQDREARLTFQREVTPPVVARAVKPAPPPAPNPEPPPPLAAPMSPATPPAPALELRPPGVRGLDLLPNRQATPRNAFTDLVATRDLSVGVLLFALAAAALLGAFHALEPGHGKTVVAAYLVGARGTIRHAALLGLTVTASHTAGVYLLGGVTLYASRYVVPERLYPWIGVVSGLAIAVVGVTLFLRRYAAVYHPHGHGSGHAPGHAHAHGADHTDGHDHADHHHHHHEDGAVTLPALLALGVTGGIVPCPAAVVVLLSALSLNRVGFGLLLIVAFSIGLAAVLIAIGILMVYAHRLMAGFDTESPFVHRWLPLASSVVITIVGAVIALQALVGAGILQIRISGAG
jgi:ABC-type nickel/cobalt efflux system permease component RcnA